MKRLRRIELIALVIVVQLFAVMHFTFQPVNLAKISYRQAERAAAVTAFSQDQSPGNKAALQQEMQLASRHTAERQFTVTGIVFAALLSFEALVIYLGRQHDNKDKAVA